MTRRPATIIGGGGDVGRLMVTVLRDAGYPVTTVDLRPHDSSDNHVIADVTAPSGELRRLITESDVVVLAVPESVAVAAAPHVIALMAPKALWVDTLSVKSAMSEALECLPISGGAVGINPMFAPSLSPANRPIAAVTYRDAPAVREFLDLLSHTGAQVVELRAERHDRLTAATQALTHAAALSFGLALAQLEVTADELALIGPPPHIVSLALLARISSGVPEVYHDVQAGNPFASAARAQLGAALAYLDDTVATGGEREFAELLRSAGAVLGDRSDEFRGLCAGIFEDLPARRG